MPGNGQPSLLTSGCEEVLDFLFTELSVIKNEATEEFADKLYSAFLSDTPDEAYFDMGLQRDAVRVEYYRSIIDILRRLGYQDEDGWREGMGVARVFYEEEAPPWEGGLLEALENTGDFFWFLVVFTQRISSFPNDAPLDIMKTLKEVSVKFPDMFSFSWFTPLASWVAREVIVREYGGLRDKLIKSVDINKLDLSGVESVDVSRLPEYELDGFFVEKGGEYYHPGDIILAITASGAVAQSLERQDLEPRMTNSGRLVDTIKRRRKSKKVKTS